MWDSVKAYHALEGSHELNSMTGVHSAQITETTGPVQSSKPLYLLTVRHTNPCGPTPCTSCTMLQVSAVFWYVQQH